MHSRIIASPRPTVETKYPRGPEVPYDEVALALAVIPRQVNRALALDESDHLRHRVLRRNRQQHVPVVRHQVPFFDPTLGGLKSVVQHIAGALRHARLCQQKNITPGCVVADLPDDLGSMTELAQVCGMPTRIPRSPTPLPQSPEGHFEIEPARGPGPTGCAGSRRRPWHQKLGVCAPKGEA
jgi:hypothetical protein